MYTPTFLVIKVRTLLTQAMQQIISKTEGHVGNQGEVVVQYALLKAMFKIKVEPRRFFYF